MCALVAAPPAEAQTRRVEILGADYTEASVDSAGTVRRLVGNVRLRQDTTLLSARQATIYEARGETALDGDVRIVSGRDTLTAEAVRYDSNTKVAAASGAVRLGDGESVLLAPVVTYDSRAEVSAFSGGGTILHRGARLTAPSGTYSSARRVADLDGPLQIEDSTGVLTAARGTYDAGGRRADVAGDVRLRRPDARLWADSVVYFRRTERARAYGHAVVERIGEGGTDAERPVAPADSSRRTFLFGERLVFDGQAETASVRGTPEEAPGAARPAPKAAPPDSLATPPGDPAPPDSLGVPSDSAAAPPVVSGVEEAPPDSLGALAPVLPPLAAPPDSASVGGVEAPPDSLAARLPPRPAPLAGGADPARDPLLVVLRADSTGRVVSTLARAPRIDAARVVAGADTLQTLAAAGGVRLWQAKLSAVADSVWFLRRPAPTAPPDSAGDSASTGGAVDRLGLFGAARPSVWASGAQLTGDSLLAVARAGALDSLRVLGTAFAGSPDSTLGRLQQIAGGQMLGRFEGGDLRLLSVWPTAQALYHRASPEGLLAGADQVSADSLDFRFRDGELRDLSGYRGVQGTSFPAASVPGGLRLPGFAFTPGGPDAGGAPTRASVLGAGWEAAWLEANGPPAAWLRPPGAPPAPPEPAPPGVTPATAAVGRGGGGP
ncbi:OstA-like protein [Rubrivirga sp. S365]|uniref:OstA-like protein n=1 Tax=Rubrivirga sp. S365 TaxID=3076080 RepID=UPI0028C707BD|nr:OstA-like protein [Rubrivirga sp. S365]MDT7856796.1 OstA-like protein [Rubrivirga sp. S365]